MKGYETISQGYKTISLGDYLKPLLSPHTPLHRDGDSLVEYNFDTLLMQLCMDHAISLPTRGSAITTVVRSIHLGKKNQTPLKVAYLMHPVANFSRVMQLQESSLKLEPFQSNLPPLIKKQIRPTRNYFFRQLELPNKILISNTFQTNTDVYISSNNPREKIRAILNGPAGEFADSYRVTHNGIHAFSTNLGNHPEHAFNVAVKPSYGMNDLRPPLTTLDDALPSFFSLDRGGVPELHIPSESISGMTSAFAINYESLDSINNSDYFFLAIARIVRKIARFSDNESSDDFLDETEIKKFCKYFAERAKKLALKEQLPHELSLKVNLEIASELLITFLVKPQFFIRFYQTMKDNTFLWPLGNLNFEELKGNANRVAEGVSNLDLRTQEEDLIVEATRILSLIPNNITSYLEIRKSILYEVEMFKSKITQVILYGIDNNNSSMVNLINAYFFALTSFFPMTYQELWHNE